MGYRSPYNQGYRSPYRVTTGPSGGVDIPVGTTGFLQPGPTWCFQDRSETPSIPCAANDPVGTWVGRVHGYRFIAPSDAARPILRSIGGKWAVEYDGVDDKLTKVGFVFGGTPFTMVAGITPIGATLRYVISGTNINDELCLGINGSNNYIIVRENVTATPYAIVSTGNPEYFSWCSALGVSGGSAIVKGRLNGGATDTKTIANVIPTTNMTIGGYLAGTIFHGLIWGIAYNITDLSTGAGLAQLEATIASLLPIMPPVATALLGDNGSLQGYAQVAFTIPAGCNRVNIYGYSLASNGGAGELLVADVTVSPQSSLDTFPALSFDQDGWTFRIRGVRTADSSLTALSEPSNVIYIPGCPPPIASCVLTLVDADMIASASGSTVDNTFAPNLYEYFLDGILFDGPTDSAGSTFDPTANGDGDFTVMIRVTQWDHQQSSGTATFTVSGGVVSIT